MVKKQKKVYTKPLILSLIILVVFSIVHYQVDLNGVLEGAIIYAVLIGVYLLFAFREQIDPNNCTLAGLCGLVISLVMGWITLLFKNYSYKIFVYDSENLHRFKGLTYNPNYLAMLCMFLLAFCVYNLINKKPRWWNNFIGMLLCLVVGLLSMSKAFLVILVFITLYFAIYLIVKFKKKSLYVIIPCLVIFVISFICFKNFFIDLFNRFIIYGSKTDSLISKILTGRTEIWLSYISEIISTIPKMLFGVGLFTQDMPINTPHNTYLFFFYRLGLLGIILLLMLMASYYESSDKRVNIRFSNILPILVIMIVGLEEVVVNERFFIFMFISLIMLTTPKSPEKKYITEVENINFKNKKVRK